MNVSFILDDQQAESPIHINRQHQLGPADNNTGSVVLPSTASTPPPASTPTVPSKRKRAGTSSTPLRTPIDYSNGLNGSFAPSLSQISTSRADAHSGPGRSTTRNSTSLSNHPTRRPAPPSSTDFDRISNANNGPSFIKSSTSATSTTQNAMPPPYSGSDSIVCVCEFTYDDGFSIACDRCGRWSHARCYDISQSTVPEEFLCLACDPREVDRDRANRLQRSRKKEMETEKAAAILAGGGSGANGGVRTSFGVAEGLGENGVNGLHEQKHPGVSELATGTGPPAKRGRGRRGSVGASAIALAQTSSTGTHATLKNNQPTPGVEDEHIDVEEEWRTSFVPIASDNVPHKATRDRLRDHAQSWRGILALSPSLSSAFLAPDLMDESVYEKPKTKVSVVPPSALTDDGDITRKVRPPSFSLHTTTTISGEQLVAPFTSTVIPSSMYLSDPLNEYAHSGLPMPFVHLIPPPLSLALDARLSGSEARFARSGCKPNAVLRPVLCRRGGSKHLQRSSVSPDIEYDSTMPPPQLPASVTNEEGSNTGFDYSTSSPSEKTSSPLFNEDGEPEDRVSFGIFALRDLKASEEVVLGWEWDDGSVVHQLPALIEALTFAEAGTGVGKGPASAGPSKMTPHHLERLRLQMQNVVHSLQSSFVSCACGKNAKDCAVRWMTHFVDEGANGMRGPGFSRENLGPLVGAKRGVRARLRGGLAMGGIQGVELVNDNGDSEIDAVSRHHTPPEIPRQRLVPPRITTRRRVPEKADVDAPGETSSPPKFRRGKGKGRVEGGRTEMLVGVRLDIAPKDDAVESEKRDLTASTSQPPYESSSPVPSVPPPPMPARQRTSSSIFSLLNADHVSPITSRPMPLLPPQHSSALNNAAHHKPPHSSSPQVEHSTSPAPITVISKQRSLPIESTIVIPPIDVALHEALHDCQQLQGPSPYLAETVADVGIEDLDLTASHSPKSDVRVNLKGSYLLPSSSPQPLNALHLSTNAINESTEVNDAMDVNENAANDTCEVALEVILSSDPLPSLCQKEAGNDDIKSPSPPSSLPSRPCSRSHSHSRSRKSTPRSTPASHWMALNGEGVMKAVEESPASPSIRSTDSREIDVEIEDNRESLIDVSVREVHGAENADDDGNGDSNNIIVKEEVESSHMGRMDAKEVRENIEFSRSLSKDPDLTPNPLVEEVLLSRPSDGELEPPPVPAHEQANGVIPDHTHAPSEEKVQNPDESQVQSDIMVTDTTVSLQDAPKVKLSMADYLKRKKKQKEEASKSSCGVMLSEGEAATTTPSLQPLDTSEMAVDLFAVTEQYEAAGSSHDVDVRRVGVAGDDSGNDLAKYERIGTTSAVAEQCGDSSSLHPSPTEPRIRPAVTDKTSVTFQHDSPALERSPVEPSPLDETIPPVRDYEDTSQSDSHSCAQTSSIMTVDRYGSLISEQSLTHSGSVSTPGVSSTSKEVKEELLIDAGFEQLHSSISSPKSLQWKTPPPELVPTQLRMGKTVPSDGEWAPTWMTRTPQWTGPETPPHQVQQRQAAWEDGEIFSSPSTPVPPTTTGAVLAGTGWTRPRKSVNAPAPPPPTQPRSFRHSPPPPTISQGSHSPPRPRPRSPRGHTPSSYRPARSSPPPLPSSSKSGGGSSYYRDPRAIPANPRGVPSGPRALRESSSSNSSSSSRVIHPGGDTTDRDRIRGPRIPPSGPSYNSSRTIPTDRERDRDRERERDRDRERDRIDWDRGRSWAPSSSRGRGRGGRF